MAVRSFSRLAVGVSLRQPARRFHMDTTPTHRDITEIFSEMITAGPQPSMERINKFMNAVYLRQPRGVTLFNINYRTPSDRSSIKGLRIGNNSRRSQPQKNVILVSGLPLQDPSTIGVNLYVAAMLSRAQPAFPCDVSVIPLAHPREYEARWRRAELVPPALFASSAASPVPSSSTPREDPSQWIVPPQENVSLELRDTCRPIEAYVTRQNKYYVNIEVDMTARGSTMQYKNNSLPNLASKGKHRRFFLDPSSPAHDSDPQSSLRVFGNDSLLTPMLQAPSLVLELRSGQALDDDQITARGEEVIAMIRELVE